MNKILSISLICLSLSLIGCNSVPDNVTNDGLSIEHAFTVDEMINAMNSYNANQVSQVKYYVKGVVTSSTYSTYNNSISATFVNHDTQELNYACVYNAQLDSNILGNYSYDNSLQNKEIVAYGYFKKYVPSTTTIKYEVSTLNASESPTSQKEDAKICYIQDDCEPEVKENRTFTLYSFNDFHGAVEQDSSNELIGLAKFGTYLKGKSKDKNTLIIDSGDTFQGSIASNYNKGGMVNDVMNDAGVDVHTLGNHDFDWGQDALKQMKARKSSSGHQWTYLASNIYNYNSNTNTNGNIQQSDLGAEYYVKTLENGLKIGVIGVIGSSQMSSITSFLTDNICFKNQKQIIRSVSDKLRLNENVDVVIASVHCGQSDVMYYDDGTNYKDITSVSSNSGLRYVDYVCCAHTHQVQYGEENGVQFSQAGANGEMILKTDFTVTPEGEVTTTYSAISYYSINNSITKIDSSIQTIMNSYKSSYESVGSEVLTNKLSGTFKYNNQCSNMLVKAMYEIAKSKGYSPDFAYCNQGRSPYSWTSSTLTYSDLYSTFPFDNEVYVVEVGGTKTVAELTKYNYCYHDPNLTTINKNTTYTIVTIDYLLYHKGNKRTYDYFDWNTNLKVLGKLTRNNTTYLYRDVVADYIRGQTGYLYSDSFDSSQACFTRPTSS